MSSLQRFAKAVVEGDLEGIDVHRREGSEIVAVGKSDGWNGSVGAWQSALTNELMEAEILRLRSLFVRSKTSTIEPMNMRQFAVESPASTTRQRLGNIRLSIRDIEEGAGDREWHLASLAQEIHDVLKSDELVPEARSWVESVHRKYFPTPER